MTRREQIARALRTSYLDTKIEVYGEGPPGSSRATAWEDLPHERKRKWLMLAATAEREVAAANEHDWIRIDRPSSEYYGRTVRFARCGSEIVGVLREVGLGYAWIIGIGQVGLAPDAAWSVRRDAGH